jgi:hypothetical protein
LHVFPPGFPGGHGRREILLFLAAGMPSVNGDPVAGAVIRHRCAHALRARPSEASLSSDRLAQREVTNITALLKQAAELLTREDGCCHQIHQTARWSDSQLIGQW